MDLLHLKHTLLFGTLALNNQAIEHSLLMPPNHGSLYQPLKLSRVTLDWAAPKQTADSVPVDQEKTSQSPDYLSMMGYDIYGVRVVSGLCPY